MSAADLTAGLFKLRFKALGTECIVQFRTPSVEGAKSFRAAALAWIKEFENTWSRFKPNSLLSRINAGAGKKSFELNEVQEHVLKLCEHTYRFTNGLNDPTSFPLTLLWDQAANENILLPISALVLEVLLLLMVIRLGIALSRTPQRDILRLQAGRKNNEN